MPHDQFSVGYSLDMMKLFFSFLSVIHMTFLVTVQCLLFTTSASNFTSTSRNAICLLKPGYNMHIRCGQHG